MNNFSKADLDIIYTLLVDQAYNNGARLRHCKQAHCYHCLKKLSPLNSNECGQELIKDWVGGGTTAICPHCGIDAILPVEEISQQLLQAVHDYAFGVKDEHIS